MMKEMFINAVDTEECRIAIIEDNELQELYIERASLEHHVGNVYKGRVTNVEPSIQAAFVDYGLPKNGFLHVSDIIPNYIPESLRRGGPMKPPIQQILKRGQEVIVQVTKEGIGTKGPTLTTYLSIAGRYLVLMPGLNRVGVSRKIEDETERSGLREMLESLERPKNLGIIIRTAGLDQTKRELQRDLNYLQRVWKMILEKIQSSKCPAEIFVESDLVARTIRDIFTSDIETIHVDDPEVARQAVDFLQIAMPRYANRVKLYEERIPLFHRYGLEDAIAKVYSRTVPLPSGGYLVIDQAEALVAIDVNSGKFRTEKNAEDAAYKLNLEAAREIARQLRLRDMGGVIVMDFVDMRLEKHRAAVEELLRKEMKNDRARSKTLKTSKFGLIEMTRQRMRPSIERSTFMECPHCRGTGLIKTPESMSLEVLRQLTLAVSQDEILQVEVTVHPSVAQYIHNRKRKALVRLEERTNKRIMIMADPNVGQEAAGFHCEDARGIAVKFDPQETARRMGEKFRASQPARPAAAAEVPAEEGEESEEKAESRELPERPPRDRRGRRRGRGRGEGRGEGRPVEPREYDTDHAELEIESAEVAGARDEEELLDSLRDETAAERRQSGEAGEADYPAPRVRSAAARGSGVPHETLPAAAGTGEKAETPAQQTGQPGPEGQAQPGPLAAGKKRRRRGHRGGRNRRRRKPGGASSSAAGEGEAGSPGEGSDGEELPEVE
jgi:ribonuclease E